MKCQKPNHYLGILKILKKCNVQNVIKVFCLMV